MSIESKLAAAWENEKSMNNENVSYQNMKPLVYKAEVYRRGTEKSLKPFIGQMELYVAQFPEPQKPNVAISFFGRHGFDWDKVMSLAKHLQVWAEHEVKLYERFQAINEVKRALDKYGI